QEEKEKSLQLQIEQLQVQLNNLQIQEKNFLAEKEEKLARLVRQYRRTLGNESKFLDKLLAAQKTLTRVLYLDPSVSETEKELAQANHEVIFKEVTDSNLSWEEAEVLCAAQEELMLAESKKGQNEEVQHFQAQIVQSILP